MLKHLLAASAMLAIAPGAVHAAPTRILVSYADLDLSSAPGQAQLDKRIAAASRRICGRTDDRSTRDMMDYRKCRETVMRDASHNVQLAIAKSLKQREQVASR